MESNHVMLKERLKFSGILKEALSIPLRNTNFIIFTLLTSLPLFCFMVLYEILFQRTLVQASEILDPAYDGYFDYNWPVPTYIEGRFSKKFVVNLIQMCFLYLVPLHLLELFNAILTVDLASKMHKGVTKVTIREMVHKSTKATRFRGPSITSMYVLFLSTCTLLGLTWLVINYYFISRNIFYGCFFVAAFIALLTKYLEWSAVWNMSIVISVVEGLYGTEALALSDHFSRRSRRDGLLFMLVFFVWGFGLRLPCLYVGCYKEVGGGVVAQVGLFCVGNVMKWVVCMVYFFDCRNGTFINEGVETEVEDADAEAPLIVPVSLDRMV
ncbi:uncharacterized protein LOC132303032 [Cornus florida]|uniref:uncharacterized protein LOC132303032 n=1 Tax=Cornus florida TaxID=4283 RepID=UPI002898F35A|nr:uncharacterized protein LOC132303032 [Cornus florida]